MKLTNYFIFTDRKLKYFLCKHLVRKNLSKAVAMYTDMRNFKKFSDNLFSSGMPTKDQLKDVQHQGIQVVINLAPHESHDALKNEQQIVEDLKMQYINIPVDWSSPTKINLITFMDLMDTLESKKIFVHCQANFRASSFICLYKILRKGWNSEQAIEVMHEIWNDEAYPIWHEFIEEIINEFKSDI